MLWEWRKDLLGLQEHRLNAYLAIVGGTFVALGFLTTYLPAVFKEYPFLLWIALVGLASTYIWMGWITFIRTVERGVELVFTTRAMNMIRGWFVQYGVDLKSAVLYPTDPSVPHFASLGFLEPHAARRNGLPTIVAIINSLMLTITLAIVGRVIGEKTLEAMEVAPDTARLIAGVTALVFAVIIFLFAYRYHATYYRRRIEQLQDKETTDLAQLLAHPQ